MDNATLRGDLLTRIGGARDQICTAWPYHADPATGVWETIGDGDWCGGHYVECLLGEHDHSCWSRGQALVIVIKQQARMAVSERAAEYTEFTQHLQPMVDGLKPYIRPTGRLVAGYFNHPKKFADHSELIWAQPIC